MATEEVELESRLTAIECEADALSSKVDRLRAYLTSELGLESEAVGNVNRHLNDLRRDIHDMAQLLRGEKDDLGLIGWVNILKRSYVMLWTTIAGVVGTLFGAVVHAYFISN